MRLQTSINPISSLSTHLFPPSVELVSPTAAHPISPHLTSSSSAAARAPKRPAGGPSEDGVDGRRTPTTAGGGQALISFILHLPSSLQRSTLDLDIDLYPIIIDHANISFPSDIFDNYLYSTCLEPSPTDKSFLIGYEKKNSPELNPI